MIKAREKKVLVGTLMLTIFGFVGKALGALFKIGMSLIVGSFGMGIYQLLFPILVFFIVFSSDGFATALTVNTAENIPKGRAYFRYAQFLSAVFSLFSMFLILLVGSNFAKLQGEQVAPHLYVIVAFGVLIVSELSLYKARLRGQERFSAYSLIETLEDFLKVILGLFLGWLLLPYGTMNAVAGILIGIILSALLTLILMVFLGNKGQSNLQCAKSIDKDDKKLFFKFSILTMLSCIVVPAVQFVESGIIVGLLSKTGVSTTTATKLFGISRGSVSAIINLPFFVISAIEVLLLPNLARSKKGGIYFKKTQLCLFFAVALSLPFVLFFMLFSSELVGVLYGGAFTLGEQQIASNLLKIGSVGIIFSAIATFLVIILNSHNKTFGPLLATIVAGVVKLVFIIFLVPKLSIYAVELSSVIFSMIVCLINLIFALKYKIIKKPKFIFFVGMFWLAVMAAIKMIYGWLQSVMTSQVLALVISCVFVGSLLVLIGIIVWLVYRKKLKKISESQSEQLSFG